MKKIVSLVLVLVLALSCAGCFMADGSPTDESVVYAPELTFLDMEGNTVKLTDYFGKPMVLNFWASWCSPCKSEMPLFQEKYEEYGDEVNFLIVALVDGTTETVESAKAYIEQKKYTFPVYFDTKNQASEIYGVNAIPTTFFIAPDGAVLGYATGAVTEKIFEDGMNRIMPAETE